MELPKPRTANLMTYFASVAKQVTPLGANQHSDRISRCWRRPRPHQETGVCFNMSGPCSGDLSEVVGLALKLMNEALAKGEKEVAKAILDRIKVVHGEYAVAEVQARLARLTVQLARAQGK